jgi:hypothetical protein
LEGSDEGGESRLVEGDGGEGGLVGELQDLQGEREEGRKGGREEGREGGREGGRE